MMRVAYVCADPGVPVFGSKGCSLHVQEVLRTFNELGTSIDLFAVRIGGRPPADLKAIRVHPIDVRESTSHADRERALSEANESLHRLLLDSGPFDLVYERHALWSYTAMEFAADQGASSILEVNAPLIDEQAAHRKLVDRDQAQRAALRSFTAAELVAPVSLLVENYVHSIKSTPTRVMMVPNGVRPQRFLSPRRRVDLADPLRIGFVGSLRPWHAVQDLIEAFALVKSAAGEAACDLVIVGDGPLWPVLVEQVDGLRSSIQSSIHFVGPVPPDNVPGWLQSLDVAVAPYVDSEACYFSPLKLFEYMAAGLPIVAARTGQMIDVIEEGATGLLYACGDLDDMAAKFDSLRCEPAAAAAMGERARVVAAEKHTWRSRVEQMLSAVGSLHHKMTPT
ncbi:MAG: glycosyltransferase family 4 protein [Aeoliella sp.]